MSSAKLHDHFRPPLSNRRHRHAFHNAWATYLASDLNSRLPAGFFAEPNVQFGIEIDVATFDEGGQGQPRAETNAAAVLWAPPAPVQTIAFALATDAVEILVYDSREGPTLAGAIELVSPANKDRVAHREAFVSNCETYLHAGAGLLIVDVVSDRRGNLHDDLLDRLDSQAIRLGSDLYTAAYHLVERNEAPALDIWQEVLSIGAALPTMPLFLRGGICLPVALDESYDRTCREQRFPVRETPAT